MSTDNNLRKAVASLLYLDTLRDTFNRLNDEVVKCGCEQCTSLIGGNYPDEVCNRDKQNSKRKCAIGSMQKCENVKDCQLYKYFKDKCTEFKVILPNDDVDHPCKNDYSWCLSDSLGMSSYSDVNKTESPAEHWMQRVYQLPFDVQVSTLYTMIYDIQKLICPLMPEFNNWFSFRKIPLSVQ